MLFFFKYLYINKVLQRLYVSICDPAAFPLQNVVNETEACRYSGQRQQRRSSSFDEG